MECNELADRLTDLLEGELDEQDEVAAVEHLATCAACESVLAGTRGVIAMAKEFGRAPLDPRDRDALWSRITGEAGSASG